MIGLLDLNNAYASMEAVFDPSLRGKALVVAGSGDGCIIARSAEAKALGVKMGQPVHQLDPALRRQLVVRSANFTLYGSLSNRVYQLVRESVPLVERYSVDELFLGLHRVADRAAFSEDLRQRVRRFTGLASCVGVARTRTLAKLANRVAKRGAGVVDLSDPRRHAEALASVEIEDVWGVGPRWGAKLRDMGVSTALQLRDSPADLIGERFGVVLLRTQRELRNEPCAGVRADEDDRKQIVVSRTFGQRVTDHAQVAAAVATFATRACEKARAGGLVAGGLQVFAHTDSFRPELAQHHPSCTYTFPSATSDTRLVLALASRMLDSILKDGFAYKKAGVMLLDLCRPDALQQDLFNPAVVGDTELMATLDKINSRFGMGAVKFAVSAGKAAPWRSRQRNLSPSYTTRLADLPIVQC